MAKSMSIKLEFVAPLPQIAITRFTYNAVKFYGPQAPRYKEVDLYQKANYITYLPFSEYFQQKKRRKENEFVLLSEMKLVEKNYIRIT